MSGPVRFGSPPSSGTYVAVGSEPSWSMLMPVVFAGDSITSSNMYAYAGAAALGAYPMGMNNDGTSPVNAGVAGNTSAQLVARFDTDVIAKSPRLVHILIGTNDAGNDVPLATFAANIKTMVAKCRAINARVILGLIPPNGTGAPTDRKALVIAYNQWLARYAIKNSIHVADYYRVLVDTSTGGYQAALDSGDHTHPSPAGIAAMVAELKASVTRPPSTELLLPKDANDPWNYVVNGLFLSSLATGWTQNGAPTGVTPSLVADPAVQGQWSKIAASASSGTAEWFQNRSVMQSGVAFTPGNWHAVLARVMSSALSSGQYWAISDKFINAWTMYAASSQNKFCVTNTGGVVVEHEAQAVAATTGNQMKMTLSSGTGDLSVAQYAVYDLTAMGVTDTDGNIV